MKFECDREEFINAAEDCQRAVGKKAIGILQNLMIEALNAKIKVTGYDLEIGITAEVVAAVSEPDKICIDGIKLTGFLRKCSDDTFFFLTDESKATIKCGKSKAQIMLVSADGYPEIPEIKTDGFEMNGDEIRKIINSTVYCAADNSPRPVLNGVCIEAEKNEIKAVGCDGYRLSEYREKGEFEGKFSVIIPKNSAITISKLIGSGKVSVKVSENMIAVKSYENTIYSRLISGDYVGYEKMFEIKEKQHFEISSQEVLEILSRISALSSDITHPVLLKIGKDHVEFDYRDETTICTDEIATNVSGEPDEIGLNVKFLSEALKGSLEQEVSAAGKSGSFILTEKGHKQVIMPMRVK